MVVTRRASITILVLAYLLSGHGVGMLFASDEFPPSNPSDAPAAISSISDQTPLPSTDWMSRSIILLKNGEPVWQDAFKGSGQASLSAGQVYRDRPIRVGRRNEGSIAALIVGSMASITGAAVLIYANRPECEFNRYGSGCGYGTKVVGGAVLTGGIAGLIIGALTWR